MHGAQRPGVDDRHARMEIELVTARRTSHSCRAPRVDDRPEAIDRVKLPAMSRFFGQVATTSLRDSGPPVYCRCFRDDGGRVDRRRHVIRPAGP